jgi:ABC-2 type transport system ATP-binding protein
MTPAVSVSNLQKTYKTGTVALKGISLTVEQGDFFALLGPNGAGKTTLIGILCGLTVKSGGEASIFGLSTDKNPVQAKSYIGLVPQEFNFNIFEKVLDIVVTQAGYYGIPRKVALERAERILKDLGLWEKRGEASQSLSGGMKRRLMIARALIHEPKLLILDEPTAGVDVEMRHGMWNFLRRINKEGTTIILTTHYLEEAEALCRNVAIINRGEISLNEPMKDLRSRHGDAKLEQIYLDLIRQEPKADTNHGQ